MTHEVNRQMTMMTDKQAYAAMYHFLKEHWKRNNDYELRNLLSFMSLLPDGSSADPAMLHDWQKAVDYALKGGEADALKITPPP
jgi:hypothetical protein